MIFIPEINLYKLVNILLEYVRQDLALYRGDLQRSFLYSIFEDSSYDKFEFFKQGSEILNKSSKRRLEVNIGYNLQRAASPTIHIIIPASDKGQSDGIGLDLGYEEKVSLDGKEGFEREVYTRSFQGTYNLLITSENMAEVVFIHALLQALFIGTGQQVELQGFQNLKLSTQDITLQQDLMPVNVYHRIFGLNFNYEFCAPNIEEKLQLTMKNFKFEGTMEQNIVVE